MKTSLTFTLILKRFLILVLTVTAVVSAVNIGNYLYDSYVSDQLFRNLRDVSDDQAITDGQTTTTEGTPAVLPSTTGAPISSSSVTTPTAADRLPIIRKRLKRLESINDDIVGWVSIANTKIDYPVIQSKDNSYYLRRNIYGDYSRAGMLFLDYRNTMEPADYNLLIYGHNMRDGTMFHTLTEFKHKKFVLAHPVIELGTQTSVEHYEIFSVFLVDGAADILADSGQDGLDYWRKLQRAQKKEYYNSGRLVQADDALLMLATCSYEFEDARLVVAAHYLPPIPAA